MQTMRIYVIHDDGTSAQYDVTEVRLDEPVVVTWGASLVIKPEKTT